jgi:hypothetical protein
MVEIIAEIKGRRDFLKKLSRIWKDPFYYAIRLPSVTGLLIVSLVVLALISGLMFIVWIVVKWIALGHFPSFQGQPLKMFIASAAVAVYILLAGIIHKRMTMPELRGRSVSFSKYLNVVNGNLVFTLVDQHTTQLVGTKVVAELITINQDGNVVARRIGLVAPGIIAIPAQINVSVNELFPQLKIDSSCSICGKADLTQKGLSLHLAFRHGIPQITERFSADIESEINSIEIFRVVLTGIDEVSGKPATAVKEYFRSDIKFSSEIDEPLCVVYESKALGESDNDDESTTTSSSATFVHIDFKFI